MNWKQISYHHHQHLKPNGIISVEESQVSVIPMMVVDLLYIMVDKVIYS